ncbi:MAG: FHA domain-containing protein [Actinomycetaceae bacterium]|nr:FHA domain-containing protein [Actinomycetaceae bacterium]
MNTTTWYGGECAAAVAPDGVVVMEPGHDDLAPDFWDRLAQGTDFAGIVEILTSRFGANLTSMPGFAVLVHEAEGGRIAVRGDFKIEVRSGDEVVTLDGGSLITWSERKVGSIEAWSVLTPGVDADAARRSRVGLVRDGVVPVSLLEFGELRPQAAPVAEGTAPAGRHGATTPAKDEGSDDDPDPARAGTTPAYGRANLPTRASYGSTPPFTASRSALSATRASRATATESAPAAAGEKTDVEEEDSSPAIAQQPWTETAPETPLEDHTEEETPEVAPIDEVPAQEPEPVAEETPEVEAEAPVAVEETPLASESPFAPPTPLFPPVTTPEADLEATNFVPDAASNAPIADDTRALPKDREDAGVQVLAVMCLDNHPNPPFLQECRICGKSMSQSLARIARPPLGRLVLSTGETVLLDRDVVLGRNPRDHHGSGRHPARLVPIDASDHEISRNHCEIRVDGWEARVRDLGSQNGTFLTHTDGRTERVEEGSPLLLRAGDVIALGNSVTISLES